MIECYYQLPNSSFLIPILKVVVKNSILSVVQEIVSTHPSKLCKHLLSLPSYHTMHTPIVVLPSRHILLLSSL